MEINPLKLIRDFFAYKKLPFRWFLSYFSIIGVVFVITIIGHLITARIMVDEINAANNRFVMQAKNQFDDLFYNVQINAYRLANGTLAKNISGVDDYAPTEIDSRNKNLINEINLISGNNKSLANVYFLLKNEDLCFNQSALFSRKILYEAYFRDYYTSMEECVNDLIGGEFQKYRLLTSINGNSKFLYIINALQNNPVLVVAEFNKGGFVDNIGLNNFGELFITDKAGTVIFSNIDKNNAPVADTSDSDKDQIRNFDNGSYITSYISSNVFPVKYIHQVKKNDYYKATTVANSVISVIYLICLIVAGILAYYLALRDYRPIDKLINRLKIDEKDVEYKKSSMRELFLYSFLNEKIPYDSKNFAKLDLTLKGKYNLVAVINITEFGVYDDDEEGHKMALFNFANVFSELTTSFAVNYYCEAEGLYLCVLNLITPRVSNENALEQLDFTRTFLSKNLGLNFTYAISANAVVIEQLPKAYRTVVDKLSADMIFKRETMPDNPISEEDDARCKSIQRYVEDNLHDGNLGVTSIAEHFGLSFNYISKYFKAHTGEGLAKYVMFKRIEQAKKLLRETNDAVHIIAEKTGFYSSSTFIRTFKKVEDITPGQYRESL